MATRLDALYWGLADVFHGSAPASFNKQQKLVHEMQRAGQLDAVETAAVLQRLWWANSMRHFNFTKARPLYAEAKFAYPPGSVHEKLRVTNGNKIAKVNRAASSRLRAAAKEQRAAKGCGRSRSARSSPTEMDVTLMLDGLSIRGPGRSSTSPSSKSRAKAKR